MQTILGTFVDRQTAQRAIDQLLAGGFRRASLHLQAGATSGPPEVEAATGRGGSVVAVDTSDDSEVQAAESIMGQLGSLDVDARR